LNWIFSHTPCRQPGADRKARIGVSRAITDEDALIDRAWFDTHRNRTCYARASNDAVLVVRQIPQRAPEDEASCLAFWERWS
jgi:hypothetical protein